MWSLTLISFGLLAIGAQASPGQNLDWWKTSVLYQIYPRSFKDSNGDGIGDLNGITEKLEHIKDAGADALWLSPIFKSPQKDFGYDISDFTDIDEQFGTLGDFDNLVAKAKKLGLKVLLDFVPNHSSDEHEWFRKSIKREKPYDDYYIWRDAKKGPGGERLPPNNWLSLFGKSAWEWNEERQQYYYHAFVIGQPDFNFHNPSLKREMENVLTFWMNRGVDGFRVDSINMMFEVADLRDAPRSGKDVHPEDYFFLDHFYSRDQDETYEVVADWQRLIDRYVDEHKTDGKFMLMEAYTDIPRSMKYYDVGTNPFNFMFLFFLNGTSKAVDFKTTIDDWLKATPEGKVSNWVVGNHDNHRAATRFGPKREDQLNMLSAVLPGMTVVYNGDEIGMVDRPFSYEETIDPAGCIAGRERYHVRSRDPERTPFQWDDSTSAGFSSSNNTWLPVHENYKVLNLEVEKKAPVSHYKVFQALAQLKKKPVLRKGKTEVLATENVLAVVRRLDEETVVLLINFNDKDVTIDAKGWFNIPDKMKIYVASVKSEMKAGDQVGTNSLSLPSAASVILYS